MSIRRRWALIPSFARMRNLTIGIVMLGLGLANIVTEEPQLDLQFKSPHATFLGCTGCLYAESNKPFIIECSLIGGTGNVVGQISIGSRNVTTGPVLAGHFSAEYIVGQEDHLASVKCQVTNTVTSLVTKLTKKLYVLVRPQIPVLTGTTVKEDQPTPITCSTMGARPPARLSIIIGGIKTDVQQTDLGYQSFPGSIVYKSSAVLQDVKRIWHQKEVKCCVTHETLDNLQCLPVETVNYLFPPSDVKINHSSEQINEEKVYTVTCTIVDANPACDAEVDIPVDRILNTTVHEEKNKYRGTTTILNVIFKINDDLSEQRVTCSANCSEFDVAMGRYKDIKILDAGDFLLHVVIFSLGFSGTMIVVLLIPMTVCCLCDRFCGDEEVVSEPSGTHQRIVTYSGPSIDVQTVSTNDIALIVRNDAPNVDTYTMSDEV